MLILTLALASPIPLTELHQRDIGCVAFFGVVADIQRRGTTGYGPLPDVRTTGARWAGIVGERVMDETGQPRELVGFAMQEAVPGAQRIFQMHNPLPYIKEALARCEPILRTDLSTADAANAPLPKPVRAQ
jgi:hypothetical protein